MNTASVLMAAGAGNPIRIASGVGHPQKIFAIIGKPGTDYSIKDLKGKKVVGLRARCSISSLWQRSRRKA